MSEPEDNRDSTSKDDNDSPPSLSIKLKKLSDLPKNAKRWSDVQLPVDILLLTVDNSEFLACHYYFRNSFKSYDTSLGYVYFGDMGDEAEPLKVALLRCSKDSLDPGGSQTVAKNAVTILRPKATFSVGFCNSLNHEKAKLGDVVISSKLTTDSYKTPVSRNIGSLVRNAADSWEAPLESPEVQEFKVHCDGVMLSCPDRGSAEEQHKLHPEAIAVEMEGKGIFAAAHDMKLEWVVVKGVSDFAVSRSSTHESWKVFASVMAASVVSNMLSDPYIFEQWPHYGEGDCSTITSTCTSKRDLPFSSSQDAKRKKLMTSDLTEEDSSTITSKRDLPFSSSQDAKRRKLVTSDFAEGYSSTITSKRDLPFSSSQDSLQRKLMTLDLAEGDSLTITSTRDLPTSDRAEEGSSTNTSKRDLPLSRYQDAKGRKRATSDLAERDLPLSSSQDAKGRKRATSDPTEPFNLAECQKQLQSFYNTTNKVKIVPWDPSSAVHINEIYTNLSWVRDLRKPSGVTEKKLEDYTEILQQGDEHHTNLNRILVCGRPGIGKTTFSKKTAYDWSQQMKEILLKFDLVLRIPLRDVCDSHDIRDVLRASKLLAGDSKISIDSLYDYILQNQEKVLLILDGYDEYSCTGEQSPIRDIWEGTLLRHCRVILTARDVKADEVKYHSHVQFKINGFNSEDQVKAFASKFLKGNEDVQEFVKYLKENDLMGMAEIPLLLLMLCLIWQEKHHTGLPTSRADIYTNFIQTLLDHMIAKDADSKQFKNVHDYNEELCKLGKLAFDALLRDSLVIHCSELPDDNFVQKLSEAGLCQILNLSGRLNRGKGVYFIHKSIQEFLAAWYLKEELLSRKDENTTCLSKVDSFEKTVKMIEVFKFACELSAEAACTIVNHLGMIGNKEGLTEYAFTETPSDEDLSNDQRQFLTFISHSFFCCTAEKRQDLYTVFLSYVGGVLLIDSDQLHSVANEHLLKSAEAPKFIFFSSDKHSEQGYPDLITVTEDLNAVVVSCSGEKKAADLLKKHPFRPVNEFFLKKEDEMKLYIVRIEKMLLAVLPLPIEMLKELISSPKSTQTKKKPVGDQSNEQDNRTALCLTENIDITSGPTRHCLSCVRDIVIFDIERQEMETLIEVLPFVTSPRKITIVGKPGGFTHDAQLAETLVSRINFTNRLHRLYLCRINLTAKPAAVIARSLSQAPNLRWLNLSLNPLGEAVSDLTRHISCVPHLEELYLDEVKMTKKQVNDLTAAVRQSNISTFRSPYHVGSEGNLKPEHEWPTEEYWKLDPWYRSEDESDAGSSTGSETEQEDE